MRRIVLAVVLSFAAFAALADTPLAPPADFEVTIRGVTLTGSVAQGATRVTAPGGVDWTIPHWLRFAYPSADGLAVLALNDGGNLIGTRDPAQIVLTLFRRDNADPLEAALSALMDPDAMPQTVSHYAWLDGVVWEDEGWTLTLSDGGVIRVNAESGVFTRQ